MKKHIREKLKEWGINHPRIWRLLTNGGGSLRVKGTGNQVINDAISLKGCSIKVQGNNNKIEIGKEVRMNNVDITITGDGHRLNIGKGVRFVEGGRIRIEDKKNTLLIGDCSSVINAFFSLCDTNTVLSVGESCLLSSDVIIRTSDSHSIINALGERLNPGANVIIGNHVWICNGARIMKGCVIGNDCIIGSNTVVTGGEIQDNQLVVGNPHRVVKECVSWLYKRL